MSRPCDVCARPVHPAAMAGGFTTHPGCDLPPPRRTGTTVTGRWLVAGTDLADVYPCLCHGRRECGRRCPCRGRADWQQMPAVCCARRAGETKQRQESGQ